MLHAVGFVTNKFSKGGIANNFSVRKFISHEISCIRITLFLQVLRQSLGIWGERVIVQEVEILKTSFPVGRQACDVNENGIRGPDEGVEM